MGRLSSIPCITRALGIQPLSDQISLLENVVSLSHTSAIHTFLLPSIWYGFTWLPCFINCRSPHCLKSKTTFLTRKNLFQKTAEVRLCYFVNSTTEEFLIISIVLSPCKLINRFPPRICPSPKQERSGEDDAKRSSGTSRISRGGGGIGGGKFLCECANLLCNNFISPKTAWIWTP